MGVARWDTLRSIGFGSTSGAYAAVGAPFTHNVRLIKMVNNTNGDMIISFDGTTDNDFIPASSFALYDLTSDSPPVSDNDDLVIGLGTQIYVKQSSAPSAGSFYIIGVYTKGE